METSSLAFLQGSSVLMALTRVMIGTTAVLSVASILMLALSHSSAAVRHRIWSLAVASTLLLPAFVLWAPQWHFGLFAGSLATRPVSSSEQAPSGTTFPLATASALDRGTLPENATASAEGRLSFGDHSPHQKPEILLRRAESQPVDAATSDPPETERPGRERSVPHQTGQGLSATIGPLLWLVTWSGGLFLSLVPLLRSYAGLRGICARAFDVQEDACRNLVASLSQKMAVRDQPAVLQSSEIESPACAGWWCPVVLLPATWRQWPDDHLRAAIAHELAHIRRRDVAWQLVARMACAVYWMHPMLWLAAWRMRVERETACDDFVLEMGEQPSRYARLLLQLADRSMGGVGSSDVAVAMASAAPLERRISAVLRQDRCRRPVGRRTGSLLTLATALVMVLAGIVSPFGAPGSEASAGDSQEPLNASARDAAHSQQVAEDSSDELERKKDEREDQKNGALAQSKHATREIHGHVLDEHEEPIAGARVEAISPVSFKRHPATRSGSDGKFTLTVASTATPAVLVRAQHQDGQLQGTQVVSESQNTGASTSETTIRLRPARKVTARVVGPANSAVEGATVAVATGFGTIAEEETKSTGSAVLRVPSDIPLRYILAVKPGLGLDYFAFWKADQPVSDPYRLPQDHDEPINMALGDVHTVAVRAVDSETGQPLPGAVVSPGWLQKPEKGMRLWVTRDMPELCKITDENGVARFPGIPLDATESIRFNISHPGYSSPQRVVFDPGTPAKQLTAKLVPRRTVRGHVRYANGTSAPNVEVTVIGTENGHDRFRRNTWTGPDGRFELQVDADKSFYSFLAESERMASKLHTRHIWDGHRTTGIELTLEPAVRVHGRFTSGHQLQSAADRYVVLRQEAPPPYPHIDHSTRTDDEGRFELFTGAGSYSIWAADSENAPTFVTRGDGAVEVNLHGGGPENIRTEGRIVLQQNPERGVPEARVTGIRRQRIGNRIDAVTDQQGRFAADRGRSEMVVHAATPDGRLAGVVEIGPTEANISIPVGPTGTVRGRLIDSDSGAPVPHQEIHYGIKVEFTDSTHRLEFGGNATTDSDGRFTLPRLAVGADYTVWAVVKRDSSGRARAWHRVGEVRVKRPTTVDVGELRMRSASTP